MRDASLRPSHFSLPAAMTWLGLGLGLGSYFSSSAAMIWAEGSTWWLGGVGCGGAAAWRCCGPAARRRCGGAAGCLILAHDEELDQSDLASAHAAACLVDDVCKEVVLGREREANELAVVAARLALHRLAKVLVVQLAVLGRRPARGREMA